MVASPKYFDRVWEEFAQETAISWDTETRSAFGVGESYLPNLVQAATDRAIYFSMTNLNESPGFDR